MNIKSVTIEGFHNVTSKTYYFDKFNYIKGPNGSGKSTVLQAIQLALLGYIPETDKNKTSIYKHSNNHTLAVKLVLDDNGTDVSIQRVWSGTGSNINSSVSIQPDGYNIDDIICDIELPVFNFNEFIHLTANKLKDWFLDFLPKSDVTIDWETILTECVTEANISCKPNLISQSVHDINSFDAEGVDQIRKANQYFKDHRSATKAKIEQIESTIRSMIYYDEIDVSRSSDVIKQEIRDLESKKLELVNKLASISKNKSTLDQLSHYSNLKDDINDDDEIPAWNDELAKLNLDIYQLSAERAKLTDEMLECQSKMKLLQNIAEGDSVCPYLETVCEKIEDRCNSAKEEYNKIQARFDELFNNRRHIDKSNDVFSARQRELDKFISEKTNSYKTRDVLRNSLIDVDECDEDPSTYSEKIATLTEELTKVEANNRYNQVIDQITAEKIDLENMLLAYKKWVDVTGVNGIQVTSSNPFILFGDNMTEYVSKFFGEGVKAEFDIQAKSNSFSFGISREDKYIPFNMLSSGEKCMYTLSLLLSIIENSNSKLKLIMIDDILDHLDDVNIDRVFNSLKGVDNIQIVLAGVKDTNVDVNTISVI